MDIHFINYPHGVNSRDSVKVIIKDLSACLGHHCNICQWLFGSTVQKCAYNEDKLIT